MYGARLGDMIGAPCAFERGGRTEDFPPFRPQSEFTGDPVLTLAAAGRCRTAAALLGRFETARLPRRERE